MLLKINENVAFVIKDLQDRIKKGNKPDYVILGKVTYYDILGDSVLYPEAIRKQINVNSLFGIPVVVKLDNDDNFFYDPVYKN